MFTMTSLLEQQIDKANGQRRRRIITAQDIDIFFQALNERADDPNVRTIRRYSGHGFVPNSYKWRIEIAYLEAYRDAETGAWKLCATTTDAKRSHGNGALTTVNGRGI